MSACELYNHALLVGMPIALTQEDKAWKSAAGNLGNKGASPGSKMPSKGSHLAKLSLRLLHSLRWFLPLEASLSFLRLSSCFLSCAPWAACTPKGGLTSIAS